jgi:hypothetical protein
MPGSAPNRRYISASPLSHKVSQTTVEDTDLISKTNVCDKPVDKLIRSDAEAKVSAIAETGDVLQQVMVTSVKLLYGTIVAHTIVAKPGYSTAQLSTDPVPALTQS